MKEMFKIKVLNIATKWIFISTVKDVFMTDLQHLIKLKKKIWFRAHHTPQCQKVRDLFLHWEPSSCFHPCLDSQVGAFCPRSLFSFKTSSIVWMVVTWACSLGGGHYDLCFMLQLKRKQGFIYVCCNQVSMSFESGKMLICIFRERWSAWSSIFLVCFLFAHVLFVPPSYTPPPFRVLRM